MSQFFNQGFLRAQYFNANYLTGAQEKSSGWRRLIIAQLQEASLKAGEARKKNLTKVKPDEIDSGKKDATKVRRKKARRRVAPDIAPEQEVAEEILCTNPLPLYKPAEKVVTAMPPWLLEVRVELASLWAKLGVSPTIVQEVDPALAETLLEEEEQEDEALLLLLSVL